MAGGLGDYFNVDPAIFRLVFVGLSVFGGSGLLLYGLGWLLLPERGTSTSIGEGLLERVGGRRSAGGIALIAVAVLILANSVNALGGELLWAAALIAVGVALFRDGDGGSGREQGGQGGYGGPYGPGGGGSGSGSAGSGPWSGPRGEPPPPSDPSTPPPPSDSTMQSTSPATPSEDGADRPDDSSEPTPGSAGPLATPPADPSDTPGDRPDMPGDRSATAAGSSSDNLPDAPGTSASGASSVDQPTRQTVTTVAHPPAARPYLPAADPEFDMTDIDRTYDDLYAIPPPAQSDDGWRPTPSTPPEPPPPPSILGRVTVAATLILIGVIALFDTVTGLQIGISNYAAMALTVIGAGLLIGARWGRARGLIALGVVPLVVLFTASVLPRIPADGVGQRLLAPDTAADLTEPFRLGVGEMRIDLRDLELDAGERATLDASVAIGSLQVIVPEGIGVEGEGDARAGDVTILDRNSEGTDVRVTTSVPADEGAGILTLDLSTVLGEIDVRHATNDVAPVLEVPDIPQRPEEPR